MLAVTPAASKAIANLAATTGQRDRAGLRIAMAAKVHGGAELALSLSEQPELDDEVIMTSRGSQVFLAPEAAHYLSDMVLDVRQQSDGVLRFTVRWKSERGPRD